MDDNPKLSLLLSIFLISISLIKAENWKFNAVSISKSEYGIGLKYNNEIIKMESTLFPLFTTTIQSGNSNTYNYVLLDNLGNVVKEENFTRTYTPKTASINEVYDRENKEVEIPSLPQVFETNYIKDSKKYKPYDDTQIYTIYVNCDDEQYSNLKYQPFIVEYTQKNQNYANCTLNFITKTEAIQRTGILSITGFNSRKYKKLSWKFKLDDKIFGRKTIKLRANANDATLMRDKINTELYEALGVPSYSSAYARLNINDDIYGLYSIVDSIGGNWISSAIHGDDKANTGYNYKTYAGADLKYYGDSNESYANKLYVVDEVAKEDKEAKGNDWYRLIKFIRLFSEWNDKYTNEENKDALESLEEFFNVEALLRQMVIESLTFSFDNFWANSGNYALYHNPEEDKYQIIPYDFDGTFYGSNDSPRFNENYLTEPQDCINWALKSRNNEDYYFIEALFKHDNIKKRYNVIMKETLDKVFNVETLSPVIDKISELIEDEVEWNFGLIDELDVAIPGFINRYMLKHFIDNVNYEKVISENKDDAPFGIKEWVDLRGGECRHYIQTVGDLSAGMPRITDRKSVV